MAFLEIDAIEVDIQTGNAVEELDMIGDKVRSLSGTLRSTYISEKRIWKFLTGPLSETESNTLRAKNGTFVTLTGDFAVDISIEALLTVTEVPYIDNKGIDFWRYLQLLLEEQ